MLMQGVPVEWGRQGLNSQNASLLIHTIKCPN
jgi:hypothetical protein